MDQTIEIEVIDQTIEIEVKGATTWDAISDRPDEFPPEAHTHDDRYYTEGETDTALSGKAAAAHTHDERYYTESEVDTALSGKAAAAHIHDERYYTESEVDTALSGKAAATHTHDDRYYTESEIDTALSGKAASSHTHAATAVTSDPFQTPAFANPLNLDATTHKDFKCSIITDNTTINLNNASDGDAGMIEIIINGTGGYTVALGTMFTKNLGGNTINTAANKDNFISWRKIATDIVYAIVLKV
jgi:hypothetical protein